MAALEAEIVAFESREVSRPPAFGDPLDVDAMDCYRQGAEAIVDELSEWDFEDRAALAEQLDLWARGEGPFPEEAEELARLAEPALLEMERGSRGRVSATWFDLRTGLTDPDEAEGPDAWMFAFLQGIGLHASVSSCALVRDGEPGRALDRLLALDTLAGDAGRGAGLIGGIVGITSRAAAVQGVKRISHRLPAKERARAIAWLRATLAAPGNGWDMLWSEHLHSQSTLRKLLRRELEIGETGELFDSPWGRAWLLQCWELQREKIETARAAVPGGGPEDVLEIARIADPSDEFILTRQIARMTMLGFEPLGRSMQRLRADREALLLSLLALDHRDRTGAWPATVEEIRPPEVRKDRFTFRAGTEGSEPRVLYRPDPDEETEDTSCLEVR